MEAHQWNTGYSWTRHTVTSGVISQAEIDQFDDDGFFVMEDLFNQDELARLLEITDEEQEKVRVALEALPDNRFAISEAGAITFAAQLVRQREDIREFARNPKIVGVCRDLIGPNVRMYHDQSVYKMIDKPRRFPWHQDNGYLYVEPQHYLTCWIALTDATILNGCPQIIPGLHQQGTLQHYYVEDLGFECFEEPPVQPFVSEIKAGGAVFFSSLTPHLTGPNISHETRKSYIIQYASSDARVLEGDATRGPSKSSHPIELEERGIPILVNGVPVS